jgi:hypothetical protein
VIELRRYRRGRPAGGQLRRNPSLRRPAVAFGDRKSARRVDPILFLAVFDARGPRQRSTHRAREVMDLKIVPKLDALPPN